MRAVRSLLFTLVIVTSCAWHADARQASPPAPPAGDTRVGPSGTVTLPLAEYDRLVDRATRTAAVPDTPPVPAVIGRAELRARVDGTSVRGTLRLEGEVFHRGAVKVPLVTGATLLDARANGTILPVVFEGPLHVAVLTGPAPFTLTLDWAASILTAPGTAALILPEPASGSATAILDLPGDPADIRVQQGLMTRRQSAGGRTTVEITMTSRGTTVTWSVRETAPPAAPIESRTLSDVKSLITLGDGDVRLVSIIDVTVVRGEPSTLAIQLPPGYEVASMTGSSLESHVIKGNTVVATVREPSRRRHQFLIGLEQARAPGSFEMDTAFPSVSGVQRESGEVAIEGIGTVEVNASGGDGLRRMDAREVNASLRSLTRQPILSAFRYQRRPNESRVMRLDVNRYADAPMMAAAVDHATATTLVTSEGAMLTEISLQVRNRAQPFMKVALPAGAKMLSVEVAGEAARPVNGADGTRIPLLRTGFRPDGVYAVSFVYLHGRQPLGKSGEAAVSLAKLDVPVNLMEWELFVPEQYSAKPVAGNVIPAHLAMTVGDIPVAESRSYISYVDNLSAGTISGRVIDATGKSIPGAEVSLTIGGRVRQTVVSDAAGAYVLRSVPSGDLTMTCELAGFKAARQSFTFDQQPRRVDFELHVAAMGETVTVTAASDSMRTARADRPANELAGGQVQQAPSQNIINMQRRVAGVLPVRMDVPRAGTSHRFFRPLVMDEETTVSLRYKRR